MSLAAWTNPELRERCLFESLHKPQTTLLKAIQYYLLYIYEHSHSNYNNNTSPKFPLSHITNTTHTVAHSHWVNDRVSKQRAVIVNRCARARALFASHTQTSRADRTMRMKNILSTWYGAERCKHNVSADNALRNGRI